MINYLENAQKLVTDSGGGLSWGLTGWEQAGW